MDEYAAKYDCSEFHKITINAPTEEVYAAARQLDLSSSREIRILFFLRGVFARLNFRSRIPPSKVLGLTLQDLMEKTGFLLLEERPPREIIIGAIGKFWNPKGGLVKGLSPDEFKAFNQGGYVKTVWNFKVAGLTDGNTLLSTETRNECLGKKAKVFFRLYWIIIRPLSSASRRAMLRQISTQAKQKAEEI